MFGTINFLRNFYKKDFWTSRVSYITLLPLILSLACFISFFVFIGKAYQEQGLPTHTSLWIGAWAAFMACITGFQCALSLLFREKIEKRIKFLTVYSAIVAISSLGAFVGNCISKDGPGIGYSVLWLLVANTLAIRIFLVRHSSNSQTDVEYQKSNSRDSSVDSKETVRAGRCRRYTTCCISWLFPVFMLIFGTFYAIEALVNGGYIVKYPAPGQLVKMNLYAPSGDTYNMHIHCVGERQQGKPLIVMESGAGIGSVSFFPLMDSLSSEFRMCAYDRAGYGWSQAGPLPDSDPHNVQRLDALLQKIGELPPYVLVGHSNGGQLARMYHQTFPNNTVGLVQLDSVPQWTYWTEYNKNMSYSTTPVQEDEFTRTPVDFIRAVFPILPILRAITAGSDFPAKYKEMNSALYNSKNWNTQYWDLMYELSTFKDGSANRTSTEYLTPGSLGSLPTMVIYAPEDAERLWYTNIQAAQAAASKQGKLIECPMPCYHSFLWDRVDFIADHLRNFTNSL